MWKGYFHGGRRFGPIQFMILMQLKKRSMYGYEMIKALREQFEGAWEPKTGTIYPALRSLESAGLVETELKEEKEYYSLTQHGEEVLKEMTTDYEEDFHLADRYFNFLVEGIPFMGGSQRWRKGPWWASPPIPWSDETGKEMRLKVLKSIRERVQARLLQIDDEIKHLEAKGTEKDSEK